MNEEMEQLLEALSSGEFDEIDGFLENFDPRDNYEKAIEELLRLDYCLPNCDRLHAYVRQDQVIDILKKYIGGASV